jgi:hypothetical protein
MVHLSVIRILRLRSASEIQMNRRFGGLQVSPRAQVCMLPTPLPRRQLLVMWMMPPLKLVTAEGRLVAIWAENPDAARA